MLLENVVGLAHTHLHTGHAYCLYFSNKQGLLEHQEAMLGIYRMV